jgi:hypothetical protein
MRVEKGTIGRLRVRVSHKEHASMLRSDFVIHNEIRRELVRTQANLGKIQFGVTRGVVYFGGEFWVRISVRKLDRERYFDVLVSTLVGLEKRLRRIPGVADIFFRFTNIEKFGGYWRRMNAKPKTGPVTGGPARHVEIIEDAESLREEGGEEK